ncbi:MAG TPA: RDD family protein, partial [Pyrinomonadaceae bacterium]|nr:RDD family protein [Pyrinomonadaceae bacterium]
PARTPAKPAAEKAVRAERREPAERADAAEQARGAALLVVQPKPAVEPKAATVVESTVAEAAPVERPKVEPTAAPPAKVAPPEKPASVEVAAAAEAKPQPRKITGVIDDHWLERREAEILPKVVSEPAAYDDRAPRAKRVAAAGVDLLAVAFLCAPFAAVIELTIGDWSEPRVLASLGGIVAVVLFLYHTCSVALASRTFGMKLFGLHAVDADTARVPTTWQCARRALVYLLSLATFGLGILYALIDAEGRTAHDLLSGTVIVKE